MNFLQDYAGNFSNGRLLSCVCVGMAFISHIAGFHWPEMAGHAHAGTVSFLTAGAGFYTVAKAPETVSSATNKQGDKDA